LISEIYGQHYECDLKREHIATIVRLETPTTTGAQFFTEGSEPMQVGRLWYRRGHVVKPHRHIVYNRPAYAGQSQEVLIVKRGSLLCHFFDYAGRWAGDWTARPGDVVIIHSGGHGFEAMEDTDVVEVKQGPYRPDDKEFIRGLSEQVYGPPEVARQVPPGE
jgi:hypothetical protein